jgi:hypothetical protein
MTNVQPPPMYEESRRQVRIGWGVAFVCVGLSYLISPLGAFWAWLCFYVGAIFALSGHKPQWFIRHIEPQFIAGIPEKNVLSWRAWSVAAISALILAGISFGVLKWKHKVTSENNPPGRQTLCAQILADSLASASTKELVYSSMLRDPSCDPDSITDAEYRNDQRNTEDTLTSFLHALANYNNIKLKGPIGFLEIPKPSLSDVNEPEIIVIHPSPSDPHKNYRLLGWAIAYEGLPEVHLYVDGASAPKYTVLPNQLSGNCEQGSTYGIRRDDIRKIFSKYPGGVTENSGFCFELDRKSFPGGKRLIKVTLYNESTGFIRDIFNKIIEFSE